MKYGAWCKDRWEGKDREFWMTDGDKHKRLEYDSPEQAAKALAGHFPKGVPANITVRPIEPRKPPVKSFEQFAGGKAKHRP